MTSNTDRLQAIARGFSILAAYEILMDFISPAIWVLTTPQSILAKVAALSLSAQCIGWMWMAASLLVMPFVLMQLLDPNYEHRRKIIKLCNYGIMTGACLWFFMAFLARNLDYQYIVFNFCFNGFGAIVMAALLANGLNNDQIEALPLQRKAQL